MPTIVSFLRRKMLSLCIRVWRLTAPRARIGGTGLVARARADASPVQLVHDWRPGWKTDVISAVLANRAGLFIDVGANVGQTLLDYLSSPVRHGYVGFEPNLSCAQHLLALIAEAGAIDSRIVPAGLSDVSAPAQLFLFEAEADPGASIFRGLRPASAARPVPVCLYRFDDLAEFSDLPISLIKIDVEGSELEVLRGMRVTIGKARPVIICEVLHRDPSADAKVFAVRMGELDDLLRTLQYGAARLIQGADGVSHVGLEDIERFPVLEWDSATSAALCDYALYPLEHRANVFDTLNHRADWGRGKHAPSA